MSKVYDIGVVGGSTPNSAIIYWENIGSNYILQRRIKGESWEDIAVSSNSYMDSNLEYGKEYEYRVKIGSSGDPGFKVSHYVMYEDVAFYIGMLDSYQGVKKMVDVTEYIENDSIDLKKNYEDGIGNVGNISMYLPLDDLDGELNFLANDVVDLGLHPFIITYGKKIIFNGYIKTAPEETPPGFNPRYVRMNMSIIHKSWDLKTSVVESIANGVELTSYLRSITDESTLNKASITLNVDNQYNKIRKFYLPKLLNPSKVGDGVHISWEDNSGNRIFSSGLIYEIKDDIEYNSSYEGILSVSIENSEQYAGEDFFIIDVINTNDVMFVDIVGATSGMVYGSATLKAGETRPIISQIGMYGEVYISDTMSTSEAYYNPYRYKVTLIDDVTISNAPSQAECKLNVGWRSSSNSNISIYRDSGLLFVKDIMDDIVENYYMDMNISENCVVSVDSMDDFEPSEILTIDESNKNVLSSNIKFSRDPGQIANNIYFTGYKQQSLSIEEQRISGSVATDNLFFRINTKQEFLGDFSKVFNNNGTQLDYSSIGNISSQGLSAWKGSQEINIVEDGYYSQISFPVARYIAPDDGYVYSDIVVNSEMKMSQLSQPDSGSLSVEPYFLNIKSSDDVDLNIILTKKYENEVDISSSTTVNIPESDIPSISENYVFMETTDGRLEKLDATISSGVVTITRGSSDPSVYVGDIYYPSLWDDGEFIELETSNSLYRLSINEVQAVGRQFNHEYKIQNAKVFSTPVTSAGNQLYLQSANSNIFTVNGTMDQYFFEPHTDYNRTYMEVKNQETGEWESYEVQSYTDTSITLYDTIDLTQSKYILSGSLVEFRRIYSTSSISLTSKSDDDDIFEAYVTKDRGGYGFNKIIDDASKLNLFEGGTDKNGYVYSDGRIVGVEYPENISKVRKINNIKSIQRHGYIGDIESSDFGSEDEFLLAVESEHLYRSTSVLKMELSLKFDELDVNFEDIRIIELDSNRHGNRQYRILSTNSSIQRKRKRDEEFYEIQVSAEEVL